MSLAAEQIAMQSAVRVVLLADLTVLNNETEQTVFPLLCLTCGPYRPGLVKSSESAVVNQSMAVSKRQ